MLNFVLVKGSLAAKLPIYECSGIGYLLSWLSSSTFHVLCVCRVRCSLHDDFESFDMFPAANFSSFLLPAS